jgi:hypothetical protein
MTKQCIDIKSSQKRTKSTIIKNYLMTHQTTQHFSESIHDMFTKPYASDSEI